ncbi:MAG TPA: endo-1,4-beta-xylanase [Anaerolineales bacterium]|nr:endo-1,4-beta-xylanase [Anaerolineales bacterium]
MAEVSAPTSQASPTVKLPPTSTSIPPTLRQLADEHGLLVGAAIDPSYLTNSQYTALFEAEFNGLVAENVMKWGRLEQQRGVYDFSKADALMDYAAQQQLAVRGHVLVWDLQLPEWLTQSNLSRDEYKAILKDHITTVVGRYAGRIVAWDVVNEPLDEQGQIRQNFWFQAIGPEYIPLAFQWAHAADPAAQLFINESYAEGMSEKSQGVFALVSGMLEKGVPIDGVGMQMHLRLDYPPVGEEVAQNMQRLAALGLKVHITELDVRLQDIPGSLEEKLAAQALVAGEMARTCLAAPNCEAFFTWGLTDHYSWIPGTTGKDDQPLLFAENWEPKLAYWAVHAALQDALLK